MQGLLWFIIVFLIVYLVKKAGEPLEPSLTLRDYLKGIGVITNSQGLCDLNSRLPDGTPIITKAAALSEKAINDAAYNLEVAKLVLELLQKGTDPNAMNAEGKTPLFYAKTYKVQQVLVDHGAELNARDIDGRTPLFYADPDSLRSYLKLGIQTDLLDKDGQSVLFSLSTKETKLQKSFVTARILHKANPELIHIKDDKGNLPPIARYQKQIMLDNQLCDAIEANDIPTTERALKAGANPNCLIWKDRQYSSLLCNQGNPAIIRLLVKYGADINEPGLLKTKGIIPRSKPMVSLLIELGARVTTSDITQARFCEDEELVNLLIAAREKQGRKAREEQEQRRKAREEKERKAWTATDYQNELILANAWNLNSYE